VLGRISQRSQLLGMAAGFFPGGNRSRPFARPRTQGTRLGSDLPEPLDFDGASARTPGKRGKGKGPVRRPTFQVVSDDEDSQPEGGSSEDEEAVVGSQDGDSE
jgi:hypothetical protein